MQLCRAICDCGNEDKYKEMLKRVSREYSEAAEQLIASGRYDTKDDFTVVFQPFTKNTIVPRKVS